MSTRIWGEEFRTTILCVDCYEQEILNGRLYNPNQPEGIQFLSTVQFLRGMEKNLDEMKYPQAFTAARSFSDPPQQESSPPEAAPQVGNLATFKLHILFRQNASWQGSITWLEGKQEESFRSVLELIHLLHSALKQ